MVSTVVVCMISRTVIFVGHRITVLVFGLCAAVLIFGLCMHNISTASSVSTVVICTIRQLCRHKIYIASSGSTVLVRTISTDLRIFYEIGQHFNSSAI